MEKDGSGAAPTGCYKCGRPGHWSRDCPSNPPSNSKDVNSNPIGSNKTLDSFINNAAEKPKRLPRTRPKLTPDLLLSNDGLGHILRHFPRAFKYRGRGHEVSDLGNLLGLYAEWHSRLLPYFSFDQFVHKLEQIGTKNRVKKCIRELRERVDNGGDPTKLHESQIQEDMPNEEQDAMDLEDQNLFQENTSMQNPTVENTSVQNPDTDNLQENILSEIWENAMELDQSANDMTPQAPNAVYLCVTDKGVAVEEEPSQHLNNKIVQTDASPGDKETPSKSHENTSSISNTTVLSEEERARMQANRLKALEKAAAARARNL